MNPNLKLNRPRTARAIALGCSLLVSSVVAAEFRESFTFDGRALLVSNVIGSIEITGSVGGDFEVAVSVSGRDGDARNITIEQRSSRGSRSELAVRFPLEREKRYVYPALGQGSSSFRIQDSDRGLLRNLIGAITGDSIKVSGRGKGLEVWADVSITVPNGGELELRHGVGSVSVANVDGQLSLGLRSGQVSVRDAGGELEIDNGSGTVEVSRMRGELAVDTGSGGVSLEDFEGGDLVIDTGSGTVSLTAVRCENLEVDTGSGGVRAEDVSADSVAIDTGSGSVLLALAEMGSGSFDIDTGSGSITLLVPPSFSAEVEADTGAGGVDVDLADVTTLSRERDEMRFRVGGGAAHVRLDTGSGRIRIAEID